MPAKSRTARAVASRRDGSAPPDERRKAPALHSTRERILSAAEGLFAEQGFGDVSMPRIAKASGITAGAIYKHFDGKADLFFEVVRRAVHSVPAPAEENSAAALARLAATYTTRELKRLRLLAVETHSASTKHPRVRRLLRQSLDHNIRQIADSVAAAQRHGELDPALDAQMLASAAMAFIMGLMHMETLLPKLVGDAKWRDFVESRVLALVGSR
jgi:AcrR family transcriptional regulator